MINRIPIRDVAAALEQTNQREFNTCGEGTVDESQFNFGCWAPLILASRGLAPSALQTVTLPARAVRVLLTAAESAVHTGHISRSDSEDLSDVVAPLLASVNFGSDGQFLRLEGCSPKDGAQVVPGQRSLHSPEEVVLRLATSLRARASLKKCAGEAVLYFTPFDARMKSDSEYRVFCPRRVAAVSQYAWYSSWRFANLPDSEAEIVVGKIMAGVQKIYDDVVAADPSTRDVGFIFDVLFDEESERIELVELNAFGEGSTTGACLFNWEKDRDILYGKTAGVEFRVAV